MKRIIICSDGTWNRPERLGKKDYPTNVLRFARGIAPVDDDGIEQIIFYDWGIGSYHSSITGGAFGAGLDKNIKDAYRFIVQNYQAGDEIYLFGFSRGAYTVRSLSGLINNCHILKSQEGRKIEEAFQLYKTSKHKPNGDYSNEWKRKNSIANSGKVHFVGVWDTVGSMGLPSSIFGIIKKKNLFYDSNLGSNVIKARHALALDELRRDFEATIWDPNLVSDLKQVWFAGCHSDVGGGYPPDDNGYILSEIPLMWMKREAEHNGLKFDSYFNIEEFDYNAAKNTEYTGAYRFIKPFIRDIVKGTKVHESVKTRFDTGHYKNKSIEKYLKNNNNTWPDIEE